MSSELRLRPPVVTAIAWLFIIVGTVALIYHGLEFKVRYPFDYELVWVCVVRLIALLGGIFALRGRNWARWLLVAWMAYHIVLSVFHSIGELLMHIVLFGIIGYLLFRPAASAYFHRDRSALREASETKPANLPSCQGGS